MPIQRSNGASPLTAVTRLGVTVTLDPNDKFSTVQKQYIADLLGILPFWIDPADPRPMREQFDTKYNFGILEMQGGRIEEDGTYHYPGDPALHPVARAVLRDETIFFYQHSMVCIRNETTKTTFMTRMD